MKRPQRCKGHISTIVKGPATPAKTAGSEKSQTCRSRCPPRGWPTRSPSGLLAATETTSAGRRSAGSNCESFAGLRVPRAGLASLPVARIEARQASLDALDDARGARRREHVEGVLRPRDLGVKDVRLRHLPE